MNPPPIPKSPVMEPITSDITMSTGMGMRFCSSSFGGRNIEAPATTSTTANPEVINASGNLSAIDEKPRLVMSPNAQITKASR